MKESTVAVLMFISLVAGAGFILLLPASRESQAAQRPQQDSQASEQDPTNTPFPIEGRVTVTYQQTPQEQTQATYEELREWVIIGITSLAACFAFGAYRAGKREAVAAETALFVVQRPIVYLSRIEVSECLPNSQPVIMAYFKNGGETRAVDVWVSMESGLFVKDKAPTFEECTKATEYEDVSTIPPGYEICRPWRCAPLTEEQFRAIQEGRLHLCLYGMITYRNELSAIIGKRRTGSIDEIGREAFDYIARYIKWQGPGPEFNFYICNGNGEEIKRIRVTEHGHDRDRAS